MIPFNELLIFVLAALGLVLTPGPNMIYLVSRSLCQGRKAGLISLAGVVVGFVFHIVAVSFGLTAVFMAVPLAYDALKFLGAAYLLWMAWQAVRPGATTLFETKELSVDSPAKLFRMGFLTNVLNPKVAVFYMSLFPQFTSPEHGSLLMQNFTLGITQVMVSASVNIVIVLSASRISEWFKTRPVWAQAQRYVMGSILAGLALRLAFSERK
jgi:threonine/homoserine/homoserine lactone efflux protein